MNPDIQELLKKIDELEKKINNLYRSSSIERPVETAFVERLNVTQVVGTGTATTHSISSLPASVPDITGTLTVDYKGTKYNLLYQ